LARLLEFLGSGGQLLDLALVHVFSVVELLELTEGCFWDCSEAVEVCGELLDLGDVLRDVCWLLLRLLDDLGHWSSSLLAALLSDLLEDVFGAVLLESGLSGSSDCIVELGLEGHDLFVLFAS
jgi:hypothetical protein